MFACEYRKVLDKSEPSFAVASTVALFFVLRMKYRYRENTRQLRQKGVDTLVRFGSRRTYFCTV